MLIVAASDTTAACLTYMFYHLSKDLAEQEKLYKEVSKFVQSDGSVAHSDLVNCDHLNGCINEALRCVLQRVFSKISSNNLSGSTRQCRPLSNASRLQKAS